MLQTKTGLFPARLRCSLASHVALQSGAFQLCLTIDRSKAQPDDLERAIARFQAHCLGDAGTADILFTGLQNWTDDGKRPWSALYFSVFPCPDGISENGKGIVASGSAAYAEIWDKYASI